MVDDGMSPRGMTVADVLNALRGKRPDLPVILVMILPDEMVLEDGPDITFSRLGGAQVQDDAVYMWPVVEDDEDQDG